MPKAQTLAEVIAGEATYAGTDQDTYSDMIGIASVVANRAKAYGTHPLDVIQDQSQFNAYNKDLPPGVGPKQLAMAQKAIALVEKNGPVISATHFATPKAAPGIKGWNTFKEQDRTIGHVYALDPNMEPVKTATGWKKAVAKAEELGSWAAEGLNKAVHAVVRDNPEAAPAMMDAAKKFSFGPMRPGMPNSDVVNSIAHAVGTAVPGSTVNYTSGLGNYGSPRHRHGAAADFTVTDKEGNRVKGIGDMDPGRSIGLLGGVGRPVGDPEKMRSPTLTPHLQPGEVMGAPRPSMQDVAMTFGAQNPTAGIGFGPGYMVSDESEVHGDLTGSNNTWGDNNTIANSRKSFVSNLEAARKMGAFAADAMTPGTLANDALDTRARPTYSRENLAPAAANPANENPVAAGYKQAAESMTAGGLLGLDRNNISKADRLGAPTSTATPGMTEAEQGQAARDAVDAASKQVSTSFGSPAPASVNGDVLGGQSTLAGMPNQKAPATDPRGLVAYGAPTSPAMMQAASDVLGQPAEAQPAPAASPVAPVAPPAPAEAPPSAEPPKSPLAEVAAAAAPALPAPTEVKQAPVAEVKQAPDPIVAQPKPAAVKPASPVAPLAAPNVDLGAAKTRNIGSGAAAIGSLLSGQGQPGDVAYSRSMPGYSVRVTPNGTIEKTNQYGVKSYEHPGLSGGGLFGNQSQGSGLFGGLFGGSNSLSSIGSKMRDDAKSWWSGGLFGGSSAKSSGSTASKSSSKSSSGTNKGSGRAASAGY